MRSEKLRQGYRVELMFEHFFGKTIGSTLELLMRKQLLQMQMQQRLDFCCWARPRMQWTALLLDFASRDTCAHT